MKWIQFPRAGKVRWLMVLLIIVILNSPSSSQGYRFNGSCSSNVECLPRETFLRCTKDRCMCSADATYDYKIAMCRLKINVKCHFLGHRLQPCVRGAFCDPPAFADGSKVHGASSGNCKCFRGESNLEDGTCSASTQLLLGRFGDKMWTCAFSTLILLFILD